MIKIKQMVFPGDFLGTSEEFNAGPGTYDDEGKIYSSDIGVFDVDKSHRRATVTPKTQKPAVIENGDTVIGRIEGIWPQMATVQIIAILGNPRQIAGDASATIHVSRISKGYVSEVGSELGNGDIVRAKVIQVKPSIQLSLEEPECGVIKALCKVCKKDLELKDRKLYCPRCEITEHRKISEYYGEGTL